MSHTFSSGSPLPAASPNQPLYTPIKRRSFFMYAGATAGATALVLAGCKNGEDTNNPAITDVGSGDAGILNYAYALEQLEAAFYAQVRTGSYYSGASTAEKQIFDDLALHEAIHRDFFKAAITATPGATLLKDLTPNFSSINFNDKGQVLQAAQTFEDTGVAAYNGAGRFITDNAYLGLAGKIVSVEARHAALIRDLRQYNSFVDSTIVNTFAQTAGAAPGTGTPNTTPNTQGNGNPGPGQERSKRPPQILAAVNNFLADGSKLSANSFA
ncbi:MAG: ferritin-like domain-containing protein [Hymenobacter sp.]|nr:MAG: ferritin-like domain-containing protein [Hymenobacter sp.]